MNVTDCECTYIFYIQCCSRRNKHHIENSKGVWYEKIEIRWGWVMRDGMQNSSGNSGTQWCKAKRIKLNMGSSFQLLSTLFSCFPFSCYLFWLHFQLQQINIIWHWLHCEICTLTCIFVFVTGIGRYTTTDSLKIIECTAECVVAYRLINHMVFRNIEI